MSMENSKNYQLRCSLLGHTQDVRAVAVSNKGDIVTASRDKSAKLWQECSNSNAFEVKNIYLGHTGFVSSICLLPEDNQCTDGYTVTGSKDSTILVYQKFASEPQHQLTGHTDTVSCLVWHENQLISGSWDHSIRVWRNWECIRVLSGHSATIWSLAILKDSNQGLILSASADKTLKCWTADKEVRTYSGHSDCVRGVSVIDKDKFLSCSNDASVRLWEVAGPCLATFYGHTNFIYSIFYMTSVNSFVTGGEDRSVRVWSGVGDNISTLYLPAQSVWSVAALPNSDLVVGTSDGVCRVFTTSNDRRASSEDISAYEESVANFKMAAESMDGIKKSNVPDKSALLKPGERDGQTLMVKDGDKILCYSWSKAKQEWDHVGEVVGSAGGTAETSGKVLFEGREYDFVFDVDLDEGRMIKLPYNKGEDPWVVAQSFIHQHELPQDYLDQVANFVTRNAGVSGNSFNGNQGSYDPFTGGSSYVPSYNQSQNHSTNSFASNNFNSPYFPQTFPLKFENVNKEGLLTKLEESNSLVTNPLTKDQISGMVEAVVSSTPNLPDLLPVQEALQWPCERVWPVLDVLRLGLRFESVQNELLKDGKGGILVSHLVQLLEPPSPPTTQLLTLRCLANLASFSSGRQHLAHSFHSVITSTVSLCPYPNKNMEISAATLLLNYTIVLNENKDIENMCQLLSGASTLALTANDPEAQFRILVTLGTSLSTANKTLLSFVKSLDIKPIIEKFAYVQEPRKLGECAKHVLKFL